MSSSEFLTISDIDLTLQTGNEIVRKVGFSEVDSIERFITVWAKILSNFEDHQKPKGLLFFLSPQSNTQALKMDKLKGRLLQTYGIINASQLENKIHIVSLAGETGEGKLMPPGELKIGNCTPETAGKLSANNDNMCLCWASGNAFQVFAKGIVAFKYLDVLDKSVEAASEAFNRKGWNDGELLQTFGYEKLNDRSRRGVWHFYKKYILKKSPEELIQDMLEDYLLLNMIGFEEIIPEYKAANEGRIDLSVVLSNGLKYIVEIKWIGRSIKGAHEHIKEKVIKEELKKWDCKYVTVLGVKNAKNGVAQLSHYFTINKFHKGYLAVYDCRDHGKVVDKITKDDYPQPNNLNSYQYKILHVEVDPNSASVKSKK